MNSNYNNVDGNKNMSQESQISTILSQESMKLLEQNCDDFRPIYQSLSASNQALFQQNILNHDTEITDADRDVYQLLEVQGTVHQYQPVWSRLPTNEPSFYLPPETNYDHMDTTSTPTYNPSGHHYLSRANRADNNICFDPIPNTNADFVSVIKPVPYLSNPLSRGDSCATPFQHLALSDGLSLLENQPLTPSNKKYSGIYDFDLVFPKTDLSSDFMYSANLSKLYIKQDTTCYFKFHTQKNLRGQFLETPYRIRALPVFKEINQCHIPVVACPLHPNSDVLRRSMATSHLLLSDSTTAAYEYSLQAKRRSLTIPIDTVDIDAENYFKIPLKFACFSSCAGGINRRLLQVIFTLEQGNQILGRSSVDVRICAAPLRDIRKEENLHDPKKFSTQEVNVRGYKRARMNNGSILSNEASLSPTSSTSTEHLNYQKTYTIIVNNQEVYELMMKVKDCIEQVETGAQNHLQQFLETFQPQPTSFDNQLQGANNHYADSQSNDNTQYSPLNLSSKELYDMTMELTEKAFKTICQIYKRFKDNGIKFEERNFMDISRFPEKFTIGILDDLIFWVRDFMRIKKSYSLSLPSSLSSEVSSTEKCPEDVATNDSWNVNGHCDNIQPGSIVRNMQQPFWPHDLSYIVFRYRFKHSIQLKNKQQQ